MTTTAAAAAALAWPGTAHGFYAWGSDVIRVGLIGCGGRGTGAARDCLRGTEGVELVALGDLLPDRLADVPREPAKLGAANAAFAAKIKVTDDTALHRLRRLPESASRPASTS